MLRAVGLVVFDFDGVFTDNRVWVSETGEESVACWRGDGIGLRRLDEVGVPYVIVSTEPNPVVARRAEKLRARCVHDVGGQARRACARRRSAQVSSWAPSPTSGTTSTTPRASRRSASRSSRPTRGRRSCRSRGGCSNGPAGGVRQGALRRGLGAGSVDVVLERDERDTDAREETGGDQALAAREPGPPARIDRVEREHGGTGPLRSREARRAASRRGPRARAGRPAAPLPGAPSRRSPPRSEPPTPSVGCRSRSSSRCSRRRAPRGRPRPARRRPRP